MSRIKLEETKNRRRLHISSFFVDLNEIDYQELINIFGQKAKNISSSDIGALPQAHVSGNEVLGVAVAFAELQNWIEDKKMELEQREKNFLSDEMQDEINTEKTLLYRFKEIVNYIKAKATDR